MKICSTCSSEKPTSEFSKDSYKPDGVRSYCKACGVRYAMEWQANNKERHNAYRRANPAPSNHGDRRYLYLIQREYGLSREEYEAMLEAQGHTCAICGGTGSRRLVVDHSHATGQVRALLCDRCNLGIGQFEDDPELMQRAVEYLSL
jgi:Recombination endonuclease VII